MNIVKQERINDFLQIEISKILSQEVKDNNIKMVTITACKVTSDLSYAKVYFTVMGDKKVTLDALKKAKGFIRKNLAERVELRHIPQLEFIYDESIEYGKKIEEIIEEIHEN